MAHRHTHLMLLAYCFICMALTVGCKRDSDNLPVIGSAFAGPITLNLRAEISPDSKTVATAKHGEKLEVLQMRRRFVRVRTPSGQIGWTDSRSLLSNKHMEDLASLAERSRQLPSQGQATVYADLNVHVEPFRASTSFYKLTEGVLVYVLLHKAAPRTSSAVPTNTIDLNKPAPRPSRRRKKEPDYPPPPRPAAPALPQNWIQLSKTHLPEPPPPPPPDPNEKLRKRKRRSLPKRTGPPMEAWTLIRTQDGKAGWVLSRMLIMAIPDEVAQYAEGARITSYFQLGTVNDEGLTKHHWLWTTVRDDDAPYDFDSFRVFTYVVRRHRYETAYIERNIEGYYPVEATPGAMPKFSLILRELDGKLYKKTWIMEGYMVRKIADEPYSPSSREAEANAPAESLTDKLRTLVDQ